MNYKIVSSSDESLDSLFKVSYQVASVLGFLITSIFLLVLTSMIWVYKEIQGSQNTANEILSPLIGFGLGASTVALFTRIGGGIYAKAADIGTDIVGKIDKNL
jgi:Na+/H+-translocating membrane pyrophosphatase